jgi:hypothetical protein
VKEDDSATLGAGEQAAADAIMKKASGEVRALLAAFGVQLHESLEQDHARISIEYLERQLDVHARAFWPVIACRDGTGSYEEILWRVIEDNIAPQIVDLAPHVPGPAPDFISHATARVAVRFHYWIDLAHRELMQSAVSPPPPEQPKITRESIQQLLEGGKTQAAVDAFICFMGQDGEKTTQRDICLVAGYTGLAEFNRFKNPNGSRKATQRACQNFARVLAYSPEEFRRILALKRQQKQGKQ